MLDKDSILDRIERTERGRTAYIERALRWDSMYRLDPGFSMDLEESHSIRKEQVITPQPYNTVLLAHRLLSNRPRIDMIPDSEEPGDAAQKDLNYTEKWLQAMWDRSNWLQRRDVLHELKGQSFVRGRHAVQVVWVNDKVPLRRRANFPILIRPLDPMNVGFHMGPYYMEYVYNTYEWTLLDLKQAYGEQLAQTSRDSQLWKKIGQNSRGRGNASSTMGEDTKIRMVDFWYVNPGDGGIWNAVLAEDEFLVKPFDTGYPDIPIIVGVGDHALQSDDEYDGLSILHGIDNLWQFECRMYSLLATGLLWYFWPGILVTNDAGLQPEDIDIGPGIIETAPQGTSVQMVQIDPNVPLAQGMQQAVQLMMQQSTFPEVLYGKSPGEVQAGYAVSMLGDAARGRVANFAIGLEATVEAVNRQVLAYVEQYSDEAGVSIMHYDEVEGQKELLTLKPSMIRGNYQNKASLKLEVPQDEQAQQAAGMRLSESNAISFATMRDQFIGPKLPSDEQDRIFIEEAEMSDEFRPIRMRRAVIRKYGVEAGMPILAEMGILGPPPRGFSWNQDGTLSMAPAAPQNGAEGLPPGTPGPVPGEPGAPGLAGPQGGGIPPQMQGQPTPADMGMTPQENPPVFQEQMGANPIQPEEELNMLETGATGR